MKAPHLVRPQLAVAWLVFVTALVWCPGAKPVFAQEPHSASLRASPTPDAAVEEADASPTPESGVRDPEEAGTPLLCFCYPDAPSREADAPDAESATAAATQKGRMKSRRRRDFGRLLMERPTRPVTLGNRLKRRCSLVLACPSWSPEAFVRHRLVSSRKKRKHTMASARARRTKRAESPRGDNVDRKRTPGEPVSRAETPDQRVAFAGLKPLIPEDKMYSYKPSVISAALDSVLAKVYPIEARTKIKDSMPTTALVTCKLVHALCASAKLNERGELKGAKASGEWRKEFESALVNALPLREHHRAFLTHNVFVTMIGAVVARALEQASREPWSVGLARACSSDRSPPTHKRGWVRFSQRFPNRENRAFAEKVISALRTYITPEDYGALKAFRDAVHAIAGESVPWTRVTMTDCCDYKPPGKLDPSANTGLSAYLDHIKD
ncbi:hypothetical protein Q5P01_000733 [Channa striata]|uniref:Uncharacterized protein n=1 Tax=Channa striata TaxID=64152 RepID=A0AA88ID54_CHASR|nr:hypothetical protein Q5P01_000733 [Channa striata]